MKTFLTACLIMIALPAKCNDSKNETISTEIGQELVLVCNSADQISWQILNGVHYQDLSEAGLVNFVTNTAGSEHQLSFTVDEHMFRHNLTQIRCSSTRFRFRLKEYFLQINPFKMKTFTVKTKNMSSTFFCHCVDTSLCNKGMCVGSKCSDGYFGYKCQYKNLIHMKAIQIQSKGMKKAERRLTDNNKDTFYKTDMRVQHIKFHLMFYPLFYQHVRVQLHNSETKNGEIPFYSFLMICKSGAFAKRYAVNLTLDLYCEGGFMQSIIHLNGSMQSWSVAEIYVNGGRDLVNFKNGRSYNKYVTKKQMTTCVYFGSGTDLDFLDEIPLKLYTYFIPLSNNISLHMRFTDTQNKAHALFASKSQMFNDTMKFSPFLSLNDYIIKQGKILTNANEYTLCGFKVLGEPHCPEGKWGLLCENNCSCGSQIMSCFPFSGHCPQECKETNSKQYCSANDWVEQLRTGYNTQNGDNTLMNEHCPPGFYGKDCKMRCSRNCNSTSCSQDGSCFPCKNGSYGSRCQMDCHNSCENKACSKTGVCHQCKDKYYGENCEEKCSENCFLGLCDKTNGHCFMCKSSFYGKKCQQNCSKTCIVENCNKWTNITIMNNTENSFGNVCKRNCSQSCLKSDYSSNSCMCIRCKVGLYGNLCSMPCSTKCATMYCNEYNGNCFGCKPGYYGEICNKTCSKFCSNNICDQKTGHCSICGKGFYGEFCSKPCSEKCYGSNCERSDGKCIECVPGYYGRKCSKKCTGFCKNKCFREKGNCFSCAAGYFGEYCNKSCGMYCSSHQCNRLDGHCFDCIPGYYGIKCNSQCTFYCQNKSCSKKDGACFSCEDNRYGKYCDLNCTSLCASKYCDQMTGYCLSCKQNYFGKRCNETCPEKCESETCDQSTGSCRKCKTGYFGSFCQHTCGKQCKGSICMQETGECLKCEPGFYGRFCDLHCSSSCGEKVDTTLKPLSKEDALLCSNGMYGRYCNDSCGPDCAEVCCYKNTDKCVCEAGSKKYCSYYGLCSVKKTAKSLQAVEESKGFVVLIAVSLMCMIFSLVFIGVYRSRKSTTRKNASSTDDSSASSSVTGRGDGQGQAMKEETVMKEYTPSHASTFREDVGDTLENRADYVGSATIKP